ncbi:hypothetical protein R1flu_001864 [Riccia fluitans]|uniref:C2H2-type domain-containing protein n=1 Tax=Riccia fluitans TaxID=41844 RepID=A0ABD1Y4H1_9MARC
MTMSRNIHLYHLLGNEKSMISMGLIGFRDTLLSLHQKLEDFRIFESAFQFWDSRLGSSVHTKLEALIFVEDLEGKVVLFETKDSKGSNLVFVGPRVETEPPVISIQPVERNVIYKEQNEGIVDVSIRSSEPSVIGDDRLEGNHRAETGASCAIVEKVNREELSLKKHFIVEGDVKREPCYSWIFKVRCVYCGSKFELVPSKRNLEHNLREHLSSEKHRENVEFYACYNIPKTSSFRFRGTREDDAALKRGSRDSLLRIRLDYLTIPELRAQAQCRARARRKEQIELFREALWEFLCDVGRNMNRVAKDYRYSKSTQAIQQALFQFGGRQDSNFEEVAKILTVAKALHGITRDVAVILAEDETRVKPTMRWEARRDTLIGFCGDKDNHVCKMGLEVEVGSGESGYSKIVESFEQKIQGSYAQVVIVNPLHEKLPRLIVYTCVTCNSFIASWVRDHWKGLKQRWDKCCRQVVDPVLGHASDGDACRRKLMLEDYLESEGQRWTVGWDGWVLSSIVLDSGDVYALEDQDPIHNGNKMINPLDRSSYPIVPWRLSCLLGTCALGVQVLFTRPSWSEYR